MSRDHRQPSLRRNGRRYSPQRERSRKWILKEILQPEYVALKQKLKEKATDFAVLLVNYAALLPDPTSRSHRRHPEPNRHPSHRERSPDLRGRCRRRHGSRQELRDASYRRWPHGSSISTTRPTSPGSPHSHTRSHVRRQTHTSEDNEDSDDIGAYGQGVLHTGFDPSRSTSPKSPHSQARPYMRRPTHLYDGDSDFHRHRIDGCGISYPGINSFDTSGRSNDDGHALYHSDYGYEALSGSDIDHHEGLHVVASSDSEEESAASLRNPQPKPQGVSTKAFDHLDTVSDSDDGYDSDLSEALSGSCTVHNEGLHVVTPSDSEEESTASLRCPQPEPHGVPTTSLKHTSADPDRDRAKGYPDVSPSLHATSDTDEDDTAPDSGEDDAGNTYNTPSSSYKTSVSDDGECSDLRSCSFDSDGDEEEIVRQATILPLQSVKADLGNRVPVSNEDDAGDSYDSPPSSHKIRDSGEDEWSDPRSCSSDSEKVEEENVRQAAGPPPKVVKAELGDTLPNSEENGDAPPNSSLPQVVHVDSNDNYSDSGESEDGDPATDLSAASIDAPPEAEGEVNSLDQDEGCVITSPMTSPKKLETAFAIASVVPTSSQDDVTGPGDSKAESIASQNASGTETPGPQPQPSSLAMPSSSKAARFKKRRVATKAKAPLDLYAGLIVRRKVGKDVHPYLITDIVQLNGNEFVEAHPCTSRPKLKKFKQYKKHFCFIGGIIEKKFETNGFPKPEKAELHIQGPPMPFKTYIQLKERKLFDRSEFVAFTRQKRQLSPESLKKFLNLYRSTWLQKSPPGSVPAAQPEILM